MLCSWQDDILLFNVIIAISKVEPELGLRMDAVPGARRRRRLKPAPGDTRRISKEVGEGGGKWSAGGLGDT